MLGAVLAVAALAVVAVLRLMAGPVDLAFLKDRLVKAADAPGNGWHPAVDDIYVEWGSIKQPIRLVFQGLRFYNPQNEMLASAPSAALTFDPRAVVQGMLLPTSVIIDKPTLEGEVDRDGGVLRRVFAPSDGPSQGEAVALLIEQLLAEPNYNSLIGQLDLVRIEHATLQLRDVKTGTVFRAPDAHGELRRDQRGVIISARARFTGRGDPVDVTLAGVYTRDRSRISVEAAVEGLKPSVFADLSPDPGLLRGINVALSGRLKVEADGHGDISAMAFEVTRGDGQLTLPGILPVSHPVKSVQARVTFDAATQKVAIERVEVAVGAALVSVAGTADRSPERDRLVGRVDLRGLPIDRLGDYWPIGFAAGGRQWALANLSGGSLDVSADLTLGAPGHDLVRADLERLVAQLDYRGMAVRYMPHMPELQGVDGTARYENGNLHFDIATGSAVGLMVAGATVDLKGLDGPPPQQAIIRMPIAGSARDVIRFLARPKLGLSKEVLYDYRRLGGQATIDLTLGFPLIDALTVAELDIKAEAAVTGFSLQGVIGELDLSDATAQLKYAGSELAVAGSGKLSGTPVDIVWREMFGSKVPFRRRYEVKGSIPSGLIAKAGFPSPEPYVSGPLGTTLSYQVAVNGTSEVSGRFDLKAASLDVRPLDWKKPPGTDGSLQVGVKLVPGGKLSSIEFDGRSSGLASRGQVRFAADNAVQQVSVSQLTVGRSDLAFDWTRGPASVDIAVRGTELELPRVRHALSVRDELTAREPSGAASAGRNRTRLSLQLQRLATERGGLGSVNGRIELAGERIASADLSLSAGKGATLRVAPAGNGRTLALYVADFGQLLSEAGWLDGMASGYLQIEGRYDDTAASSPFGGLLKLGPYHLQKVAPRPGIGTLNAAIDGLGRAGNPLQQFDGLQADVSKTGDRVHVRNGRTSGPSIGLTTQGFVDLGNDTARLAGVVVPAFALNNLLSNVPLLGPLLTGGKDGGVFAVAYQLYGPLSDLKTSVNLMSAMTPGALRDLFAVTPDPDAPAPAPPPAR